MATKVSLHIRLKEGFFDPEAEAITKALKRLEFSEFQSLERERVFHLNFETNEPEQALKQAREMAQKLLVNLVMEDYHVEIAK